MEIIKTEREKCIEDYLGTGIVDIDHGAAKRKVEPALDTQGMPYEIKNYGIKPVNTECKEPIIIGDIRDSKCIEGQYESDTYEVKYPETKEEQLTKYYNEVLRKHKESCKKAKEYKETHECLPGTVFKESDEKDLSKYVKINQQENPSPENLNPCLLKKTVRFAELEDECKQPKDDICNLNPPSDHCGCTEYNK